MMNYLIYSKKLWKDSNPAKTKTSLMELEEHTAGKQTKHRINPLIIFAFHTFIKRHPTTPTKICNIIQTK